MGNKERYIAFCEENYVPVYSQPWWMDAVCGSENWDVWLYERSGTVAAAMPYYLEKRKHGLYITKAPLTQNNGIVFRHDENAGYVSRAKFEERVISAADDFICGLGLAVYEQQFQTSFSNWLPFSWRGYDAMPRYTYVIEDTSNMETVWGQVSSKQRSIIRKGKRNVSCIDSLNPLEFYEVHKRVFERQGLSCPFSRDFWLALEEACSKHGCSRALCARDKNGSVASFIFLVWDERRMYHLLGGSEPSRQKLDTYGYLIWHAIELAHAKGLSYDFEGSMIERISKSFREFGGIPKLYFRIRKIFSAEVMRMEAERRIERST